MRHVRTFEPGSQVAPGVTSVALDGHTPGHVGYELVSGDSRLLDIGDMAHSSIVSLEKPQWTIQYDNDSPLAKTTRSARAVQACGAHSP
jgi:glyoxylase-like metal-dependent hydrolase (beta-lactamase superfamily II)